MYTYLKQNSLQIFKVVDMWVVFHRWKYTDSEEQ